MDSVPTKLDYYDNMFQLESKATLISYFKGDDGRHALILDSTIFHPQGGGQPSDTGFVTVADGDVKFTVQDVRSRDGIVFHYGVVESCGGEFEKEFEKGRVVSLHVDESRRKLNSRPFVGYKGTVPQSELQSKAKELEQEANAMISSGGKVYVAVLPYEEASKLCDGCLPDYIPKDSTPRIVKLGNSPGCPCGGTHVSDISEITSMKADTVTFTYHIKTINFVMALPVKGTRWIVFFHWNGR